MYNKHDELAIYKDWQNESGLLGTAKLVRKHPHKGLPFILNDIEFGRMIPSDKQEVYNYEV